MEYLYLPANEVRVGDFLPTISREPVSAIHPAPDGGLTFRFLPMATQRYVEAPGAGSYGYECFRVERSTLTPDDKLDPAPEGWEDYELVNAA